MLEFNGEGINDPAMSLQDKIKSFNPNNPGQRDSNLFGLPFTTDEARCVVVPVPWEVTVSYGGGTLLGPEAVLEASRQVDLYDPILPDAWKLGVAMDIFPEKLKRLSRSLRKKAEFYISKLEEGSDPDHNKKLSEIRRTIDSACAGMVSYVESITSRHLQKGKMVALIGGDHSTPLGFLQALAKKYAAFGVLQIDAHADLRNAYEGFQYSHASIMYNALKIKQIKKLVQVGIRDYCEEEVNLIRASRGRVKTYFDRELKRAGFKGKTTSALHAEIVKNLPKLVYISFDIDGLDPKLCPHTGTPVPGGFEFEEAVQLVQTVADSGRTIIGLDVNEVSPREDEWDANVGARLLFRMINIMAKSQKIKR